jgi:hypothetical protein
MNQLITIIIAVLIPSAGYHQLPAEDHKKEVDEYIDSWHQAAWDADSDTYFGMMDDDCIFIGTDLSEVWTKQEFFEWSRPYFDSGRVWKFKGRNRHIYFNQDETIAWFDEEVHSSAGVWRGSGVLSRESGEWTLKQYVLSMTVPNDLMDKVIKDIKVYNDTIKSRK